mmetsp:Transcript_13639/g.38375  ORF Transcript_13639/g.38375 Transcript_13639/m.38375 type:complete len:272 (+) Transcript_13639:2394-3209(+)
MVNQSPGCCNDNFNSTLQITNLSALWDTTIDYCIFDITRFSEFVALFFDLNSEFSGRREDQHNGSFSRFQVGLCVDVDHCRQQKCKSLSTTGGTDSDRVLPLESHRPSLRLNRSWRAEAAFEDLAEDVFRHGCFLKGHARLRNVLSDYHDSLGSSPFGGFLFTTFCHVGVFHVEIFLEGYELFLREINVLQVGSEVSSPSATPAAIATASVTTTASSVTAATSIASASPAISSIASAAAVVSAAPIAGSTTVVTTAATAAVASTAVSTSVS